MSTWLSHGVQDVVKRQPTCETFCRLDAREIGQLSVQPSVLSIREPRQLRERPTRKDSEVLQGKRAVRVSPASGLENAPPALPGSPCASPCKGWANTCRPASLSLCLSMFTHLSAGTEMTIDPALGSVTQEKPNPDGHNQ